MYYFAYGSNMNHKQIQERCSSARFIISGYVRGYRFVYDGYSGYRKGAVANIVKNEKGIVWGGIFEISGDDLKKLDSYEGYPNVYGREIIVVNTKEGKQYECWVYLREPKQEGKPSKEYLETILQGAKDCDLPPDYIKRFLKKNLT